MVSHTTVLEFENKIANYFGSNFAVATDSCTHAIELCLRYKKFDNIKCPAQTYLSVPMTFIKLGLNWSFRKYDWQDYYWIDNTNIIDAAPYWQKSGYIPQTYMCLSFQHQKTLSLGRGGAILCSDKDDYIILKQMSHDGKDYFSNKSWPEQTIERIGYHYYMTPDTAQQGLEKIDHVQKKKNVTHKDYPVLSEYEVFK